MLVNILLLILGFLMLIRGADYFVDGSSALAKRMHIPSIIIGLTVVAMGTSAPEAAVSISSAIQGSSAIAIGNIIGSNIANILLILGITSIITTLTVQKNTVVYETPFVILITTLLCAIGWKYGEISRVWAGALFVLFLGFLGYLYAISKNSPEQADEIKSIGKIKIVLYIVLGAIALVIGSKIAVAASCEIARYIGVSERIIGLTLVAFGTSLPELVTSVIAARKGEADIAIGNIIGSNIFNILFILSITGLILPIPFDSAFLVDGAAAIFAAILLLACMAKNMRLTRPAGVLFILCYAAYLVFLTM